MSVKTTPFDAADYLDSDEACAEYITAAFETNDPAIVAQAIGTVARARGMTEIARNAGLGRESLYRALGPEGNPELATLLRVMKALGLELRAAARQ